MRKMDVVEVLESCGRDLVRALADLAGKDAVDVGTRLALLGPGSRAVLEFSGVTATSDDGTLSLTPFGHDVVVGATVLAATPLGYFQLE